MSTITNVFNHLKKCFQPKQYLLIKLSNEELSVTRINKHGQPLLPLSTQRYQLTNHEIIDTRIFNPTALHSCVQQFIDNNGLTNPHLTIVTSIKDPAPWFITQVAICFSKKPFIIDYISSLSEENLETPNVLNPKDNLLNQFLPASYHTTGRWITMLTIMISICLLIVITFNSYLQRTSQFQKKTATRLKNEISGLQHNIKSLQETEKRNIALEAHIHKLAAFSSNHQDPFDLCLAIAQRIPPHSYLSLLEVGSLRTRKPQVMAPSKIEAKHDRRTVPLVLHGFSTNPAEINDIVKELENSDPYTSFFQTRIKRIKQSNVNSLSENCHLYSFELQGELKIKPK